MSEDPLISVVIPTYNSERTICRALSSVFAQTLQPIELIVVDDGSTDSTVSLVKSFHNRSKPGFLKLVELGSNHGVYHARNVGWDMASGEFLAFLDADDSWHPRKLEIQTTYMQKHNELALTAHRFVCISDNKSYSPLPTNWSVKPISSWQALAFWQFSTPSVMIKREIPYRFDPCKRRSGDRLLWLQILLNGYKAARLELPLVYLYKRPWGEAGLSENLWEAEKAELDTFTQLRRIGLVSRPKEILLQGFALLKFLRRVWLCWRRSYVR